MYMCHMIVPTYAAKKYRGCGSEPTGESDGPFIIVVSMITYFVNEPLPNFPFTRHTHRGGAP